MPALLSIHRPDEFIMQTPPPPSGLRCYPTRYRETIHVLVSWLFYLTSFFGLPILAQVGLSFILHLLFDRLHMLVAEPSYERRNPL